MVRSPASVLVSLLAAGAVVVVAASCEVPTPLAPAEPIGEIPRWGEGFATPTEQPASMLGEGALGNSGLPAGTQSPGDTGSWAGGDPALGKQVFTTLCAKCHGENGEGTAMGPSLADAKWQASVEDRQIARSVALGKGKMPAFMKDLDKSKLAGVIAHIRTLKQ